MPYGIEYAITKEQAEFIKDLRVNKDYSWRAVARDFCDKYPNMNIDRGNQIDGICLCDAAMKFFNETVENGWN